MYELEVSNIPDIIDHAPKGMNLMFIGDTGIGKTTVIERWARDTGTYLKTLILSRLEASESLGIPVRTDMERNDVTYPVLSTAIPMWVFDLYDHLHHPNYPGGACLFLDEFLCTQPSTMNSFLNFLTQRMIEGMDFRDLRIIAATNVGNYTFDPDTNMIARFCMFYTVNTKVNEYLNDDRIINNYRDENERTGVLFEQRSLKPRCQEWLKTVDDDHLQMFYEGFTNRKYVMVHKDPGVNEVVSPYFVPENARIWKISDENISSMVSVMTRTFNRIRKWDTILSNFVNIDITVHERIKECVRLTVGDDKM